MHVMLKTLKFSDLIYVYSVVLLLYDGFFENVNFRIVLISFSFVLLLYNIEALN